MAQEGKWHKADSFYEERPMKQHYYIPAMRGKFYEEPYMGNRTLCLSKGGIINENEKFVTVDEIHSEEQRSDCCKMCLKLYNSQHK